MIRWIKKYIIQIIKNQRHILFLLSEMKRNGKISNGNFSIDKIGNELQDETYKLIKELEN